MVECQKWRELDLSTLKGFLARPPRMLNMEASVITLRKKTICSIF